MKTIKCSSFQEVAAELTKDTMWIEPRDVWYVSLDPFWADFRVETKKKPNPNEEKGIGKRKPLSRHATNDNPSKSALIYPFVDAIAITAWLYLDKVRNNNAEQQNIHALVSSNGLCKVQLTHYQYLFIMRMAEAFGELSLFMTLDAEQIVGKSVLNN